MLVRRAPATNPSMAVRLAIARVGSDGVGNRDGTAKRKLDKPTVLMSAGLSGVWQKWRCAPRIQDATRNRGFVDAMLRAEA